MKTYLSIFSFLILIFLFQNCGGTGKDGSSDDGDGGVVNEELILKKAPKFNGDSAYLYVKNQVDFGPRVPNTEAHKKCKDFLVNKLKSFGAEVEVQEFMATAFDGNKLESYNIIGKVNPKASTRILLAAHWDTRPFADKEDEEEEREKPIDGANDGASGVGVLLEVARAIQISPKNLNVGVDIIFFDSEDYGHREDMPSTQNSLETWCLGSQHWAKNKGSYTAYYGILLDMVGAKNALFYQEGLSREVAPSIVKNVWNIANKLNYGKYFPYKNSPGITDDHVYMNQAGIPTINIVQFDPNQGNGFFGDYHHTHKDNMDIIDSKTLEAVGQTLVQTLYNEEVK